MTVVLVVLGLAVFAALLFGFSARYDAHAAALGGENFGAAAGVHMAPLERSALLADRLQKVRWRPALRVGINPGRVVLDERGAHWTPSFLNGTKVPEFSVKWSEIDRYDVKRGPKIVGRRVAHLTLGLRDGTPLRLDTYDPDGLASALARLKPAD